MLEGNLRGLQHLGLPVTQIDRSMAFYRQLGFKTIMTADLPRGEETIQVAMMENNGLILELYQLVGEEHAEIGTRGDGHIDHVALDVADIDRAFEDVCAAGLETLEDAPVFLPFWDKGMRYFDVRGPDGEKIEFSQKLS